MSIPLFDCHCDTAWQLDLNGGALSRNAYHVDLERWSAYAPRAQVFAIWGSTPADFDRQYRRITEEFARNAHVLRHCLTANDAQAAAQENKLAAFLSVEGAEQLDCSPEGLEKARRLGVRMVGLTWNNANLLSGTNVQESDRGLSPAGRVFFQKIQELGMIADMSHISQKGFFDCAELARAPIIASHSNSAAVFPHKRNLTDAQFRCLMDLGGVAGINLYAEFVGENPGVDHVVAHIEHFCALGGERNICIGADLDGCDALPKGISGVQDIGKIYEALLRRNYPERVAADIFYNNLMRVTDHVLREHKR